MLRFTFNLLLIIFVFTLVSTAGLAWFILPQLPEIDSLREVKLQVPLRVYSSQGSLIAEFGEKRRTPVTIEEIPARMINAIVAAEDDRFFEHPGVDWQGIVRAGIHLIKTGDKTQGGSTITMQVARNFFLSREKTYLRKINEIFLALKIERELSKEEILELYLNKIYLGQRAYGIAAAAQVYYGLKVNELTLPKIAMLAGLPKAPSTTNPISNPDRAISRRNYVLQRMLIENYINDDEYQTAITEPITARLHTASIELNANYVAEMVRSELQEQYGDDVYTSGLKVYTTIHDDKQIAANKAIKKALIEYDERHGYRGPEQHFNLDSGMDEAGWEKILDSFQTLGNLYPALVVSVREQSASAYLGGIGLVDIGWEGLKWAKKYISENRFGVNPKSATEILETGDVIRLRESEDGRWILSQLPVVEGALVSINPQDGSTYALTGGFDFYRSNFNRALQARRQPGSGFKPFIYSAALEAGFTASTLINDAPVVFDDPGAGDVWRPENYSQKSYGPTRLREALTHSRNLVSIRLLDSIGVPFALDHIAKFGFDTSRLPKNLSIALGSGEVTPWEQARGYAVFANGGYLIEPYLIQKVYNYEDDIIYEANPKIVCSDCEDDFVITENFQTGFNQEEQQESLPVNYAERVVDARNIWIMNSITRDVIKYGTGRRALELGRSDLSGKTGTTNDQHDAWFSGFNTNIVTICWVGFDKFLPLGRRETGARAALPMWIEYMKTALTGMPETIMKQPSGLVYARIDPVTGKLAPPNSQNAMFEVFRAENAPGEIIEDYPQEIIQNTETGDIPLIF